MADKTSPSNPWLDAWLAGQQQFLKMQPLLLEAMGAGADMSETVRRNQATWEALQKQATDWLKVSERWLSPQAATAAKSEGIAAETLRRMLDPNQFLYAGTDEINHAIQRLVEGPEFADIGTLERQVLKATAEWLVLREASAAYRAVIGQAWSRAFEIFSSETAGNPEAFSSGPKAMLDRWLAVANEELIRTQRTDEFLDAQRKLLRAGVNYRIKERELVEVWCETHSIPTRTEVDDLHRTVYQLRHEVRELTRKVNEGPGAAAGGERTVRKKAQTPGAKSTARRKKRTPSDDAGVSEAKPPKGGEE